MNLLEVGALLKRERERRGISIRDVMDATKISRRNLTALEEGQYKSLPHPVYLKGYVRNIAKMVGLDDDGLAQVVDQQYDAELGKYLHQAPAAAPVPATEIVPPAPPTAPATAPAPMPKPEPQPAPQPQRQASEPEREARPNFTPEPLVPPKPKYSGTWRSVMALVLLVAALAVLLVQYQRMRSEEPPAPVPVVAPVDNATNATALDNATTNATALDNATAEVSQPEPALPVVQPEPDPARAAATPSAPVTSIEVSRKAAAPVSAAGPAPAPGIEARTPGAQTLTITAKNREVCWVGVFEGAKRTTFTLREGESRQVEFVKRASLRLGNAGGVTVRLNGKDYPFEGDRGQKVTLEFGTR